MHRTTTRLLNTAHRNLPASNRFSIHRWVSGLAGVWYVLVFAVSIMLPSLGLGQESPPPADPIERKAATEATFKLGILGNFLDSANNQVLSLASSEFTHRYAAAYQEADRGALVSLFHAVAGANTDYMQVRFLDMHGRERVRIDRPKGKGEAKPIIVAAESMQDKGTKFYFQGPKSIPEGRLWHSRFNLNMEQGKIEEPIRPTFRVSTPVHVEGLFRGKERWSDSKRGDEYRDEFIDHLKTLVYSDGSSPVAWCHIQYGDDDGNNKMLETDYDSYKKIQDEQLKERQDG